MFRKEWWKENKESICYSIFIMVVGPLLHFLYDWTGQKEIVAMISAIDESVWEHLKLFFVPAFLYTAICIGKEMHWDNYVWCQTKSILSGLAFLITFYFTYTGITRRNYSFLDIGSFYVAAVFAGVIRAKCLKSHKDCELGCRRYAGAVLLILWALFVWFSYSVPELWIRWLPGLFVEP